MGGKESMEEQVKWRRRQQKEMKGREEMLALKQLEEDELEASRLLVEQKRLQQQQQQQLQQRQQQQQEEQEKIQQQRQEKQQQQKQQQQRQKHTRHKSEQIGNRPNWNDIIDLDLDIDDDALPNPADIITRRRSSGEHNSIGLRRSRSSLSNKNKDDHVGGNNGNGGNGVGNTTFRLSEEALRRNDQILSPPTMVNGANARG